MKNHLKNPNLGWRESCPARLSHDPSSVDSDAGVAGRNGRALDVEVVRLAAHY